MPPAVVTFYITRTELSLANLSLVDASNYMIPDENGRPLIDEGNAGNIVNAVESAWMDGDTMVHRRKGKALLTFSVDIIGFTKAKQAALEAAVDQSSFEIHYTIDGEDFGWACQPYQTCQALWDDVFVYGDVRRMQIAVPRQPNRL